jgi:D-amino peptidase
MKIYIMSDLEGIGGISHAAFMEREGAYYQDARRLLMRELNAAIAGAFDGGATEVYARDGHGQGCNFILDELDPRATHELRKGNWYSSLDASFDATFFIGAHAMAGTRGGFLTHTQSSRAIFEFKVNGRPMGELGQWALGAGDYDIPLVFVSGDEAACAEAREFFPGIHTVAVKKAIARNVAQCYPVEAVCEEVRRVAAESLRDLQLVKPFKVERPIVCEQTYVRCDIADTAEKNERYERVDGRTCRQVVERQQDAVM